MMDLKEWKEKQLQQLKTDMDRMVGDFFRDFGTPVFDEIRGPTPLVDIVEKDEVILITMELPGIEAHDLEVAVSPQMLVIGGRKKDALRGRGSRIERSRTFSHRLKLRCRVDPDRVEATYRDNRLTISLPKCSPTGFKKIPVRLAGK
jgi:HSP20 family protein